MLGIKVPELQAQNDSSNIQLQPVTAEALSSILSWFANRDDTIQWAGPTVTFPLSIGSVTADLNIDKVSSCVLMCNDNSLLGFGQYYQRGSRCHLARLVINPLYRGRGLVKDLITCLITQASQLQTFEKVSLFVFKNNKNALASYRKLGFVEVQDPLSEHYQNCIYMESTLDD